MSELQQSWIDVGYAIFAGEGPNALKVEVLARQVNKSKSSFYHHFVDMEIFVEHLLKHHLNRSAIISEEERQCQNVIPELLEVLIRNKQDLLFNRQLRIHRNVPAFQACFQKASEEVGGAIAGIWAEALGLQDHSHLAQMVLKLSLENFYLQITAENLNYDWLEQYMRELQSMIRELKNA